MGVKFCLITKHQHAVIYSFVLQEVLLDMKETHLTCTDRNSKLVSRSMFTIITFFWLQLKFFCNNTLNVLFSQELFQHHYPEISCVGKFGQTDYTVFAFCVA